MVGMMMMKALCIIIACNVMVVPYAEAITCREVVSKVLPCLGYLKSGGAVPLACCSGVKGMNDIVKSSRDRKIACSCLKIAYTSYSGLKANNALGLPGKCDVNVSYKISPDTDCSKYVAVKGLSPTHGKIKKI
ncbi:Bifunctional inhibitor/plant lipid transfer protein/seed storage helical domain-containing protein [Cynara cardunculus var. scolymus]|uniref:Non-specific lipid-transfer protein n=1 Tax=Cynara cardunculus var. scolymus TaxID=59895 RepID=A0A103XQ99_CYNCS|nr:Bifunctional inhibitor/plant lipid transfer protein/seed storage helical domain-containing protein [Cynara cardunculus var. scolymus]